MNKKAIAIAVVAALGLTSQAASAKGWTVLAGLEDGYTPEPTVSVIGGVSKGNVAIYGAEFSLNCPLLQPPTNKIRQQASYVYADGQNNIQLNPHYVVEVSKNLWIGAGPALGVGFGNSTNFAAGLGASAHYEMGPLFLGAESGYTYTTDSGAWRALAKVGFNIR